MTPDLLPLLNVTIVTLRFYTDGIKLDEVEVESINGSASYDVFYNHNDFMEPIHVMVCVI